MIAVIWNDCHDGWLEFTWMDGMQDLRKGWWLFGFVGATTRVVGQPQGLPLRCDRAGGGLYTAPPGIPCSGVCPLGFACSRPFRRSSWASRRGRCTTGRLSLMARFSRPFAPVPQPHGRPFHPRIKSGAGSNPLPRRGEGTVGSCAKVSSSPRGFAPPWAPCGTSLRLFASPYPGHTPLAALRLLAPLAATCERGG